MKTLTRLITMVVLSVFLMVSMFGCYGSFHLTRKVYEWNGQIGDRFMTQIAFWVLTWLPVYSAATSIDLIILNLIEFWTGSNPLAMNDGQEVIRYAQSGDDNYKITVSNQTIKIEPLTGDKSMVELSFDADAQAWFLQNGNVNTKVATVDGETLNLLYPDGRTLAVSLSN